MKTVLYLVIALIVLPVIGSTAQLEEIIANYPPSTSSAITVYTGTGLPTAPERKFVLVLAEEKFSLLEDGKLVSNNSFCFLGYCILLYFPDSLSYSTLYQFGLASDDDDTINFTTFFAMKPNPPTLDNGMIKWSEAPMINGQRPVYDLRLINDSSYFEYVGEKTTIRTDEFNQFNGDSTFNPGDYRAAVMVQYINKGFPELHALSQSSDVVELSFTASSSAISTRAQNPFAFRLAQNYPNPFNPTTTVRYELPTNGSVNIRVYDITGRLVKLLVSGWQTSGAQNTIWDGTDFDGNLVAAGIYICQIEFTGEDGKKLVQSKKMSLVK
ncbi:MAG: T9SS type A sorting domain-containing protein [Dehalococcoidia bacterium]